MLRYLARGRITQSARQTMQLRHMRDLPARRSYGNSRLRNNQTHGWTQHAQSPLPKRQTFQMARLEQQANENPAKAHQKYVELIMEDCDPGRVDHYNITDINRTWQSWRAVPSAHPIPAECFNAVLAAHNAIESGERNRVSRFLDEMSITNIIVDQRSIMLLFEACVQLKDPDQTMKLLRTLRERVGLIDNELFDEMLRVASSQGSIVNSLLIFDEINRLHAKSRQAKGLEALSAADTELLAQEEEDLNNSYKNAYRDPRVMNNKNEFQIYERKNMARITVHQTSHTYMMMALAFASAGNVVAALNICQQMIDDENLHLSMGMMHSLLDVCQKQTDPAHAHTAFLWMKRSKDLKPDHRAYVILFTAALKKTNMKEAVRLYEEMMSQGFSLPDDKLIEFLLTMINNPETYGMKHAVQTLEAAEQQKRQELLEKHPDEEWKPSITVYTAIIDHCDAEHIDQAQMLFDKLMTAHGTLTAAVYGSLIRCYAKGGSERLPQVKAMFSEVEKLGIAPNIVMYNALLAMSDSKIETWTEVVAKLQAAAAARDETVTDHVHADRQTFSVLLSLMNNRTPDSESIPCELVREWMEKVIELMPDAEVLSIDSQSWRHCLDYFKRQKSKEGVLLLTDIVSERKTVVTTEKKFIHEAVVVLTRYCEIPELIAMLAKLAERIKIDKPLIDVMIVALKTKLAMGRYDDVDLPVSPEVQNMHPAFQELVENMMEKLIVVEHDFDIRVNLYRATLASFIDHQMPSAAFLMMHVMRLKEKHALDSNMIMSVATDLIRCYSEKGENGRAKYYFKHVIRIFDTLSLWNIPMPLQLINQVIADANTPLNDNRAHTVQLDSKSTNAFVALQLFEKLKEYRVAPDSLTFRLLLSACSKNDAMFLEYVPKYLVEMERRNIKVDSMSYLSVLAACRTRKMPRIGFHVMDHLEKVDLLGSHRNIFVHLINLCAMTEPMRVETAFVLWDRMQALKMAPDVDVYTNLFKMCAHLQPSHRHARLEFVETLQESMVLQNIVPTDICVTLMFQAFMRWGSALNIVLPMHAVLRNLDSLDRVIKLSIYKAMYTKLGESPLSELEKIVDVIINVTAQNGQRHEAHAIACEGAPDCVNRLFTRARDAGMSSQEVAAVHTRLSKAAPHLQIHSPYNRLLEVSLSKPDVTVAIIKEQFAEFIASEQQQLAQEAAEAKAELVEAKEQQKLRQAKSKNRFSAKREEQIKQDATTSIKRARLLLDSKVCVAILDLCYVQGDSDLKFHAQVWGHLTRELDALSHDVCIKRLQLFERSYADLKSSDVFNQLADHVDGAALFKFNDTVKKSRISRDTVYFTKFAEALLVGDMLTTNTVEKLLGELNALQIAHTDERFYKSLLSAADKQEDLKHAAQYLLLIWNYFETCATSNPFHTGVRIPSSDQLIIEPLFRACFARVMQRFHEDIQTEAVVHTLDRFGPMISSSFPFPSSFLNWLWMRDTNDKHSNVYQALFEKTGTVGLLQETMDLKSSTDLVSNDWRFEVKAVNDFLGLTEYANIEGALPETAATEDNEVKVVADDTATDKLRSLLEIGGLVLSLKRFFPWMNVPFSFQLNLVILRVCTQALLEQKMESHERKTLLDTITVILDRAEHLPLPSDILKTLSDLFLLEKQYIEALKVLRRSVAVTAERSIEMMDALVVDVAANFEMLFANDPSSHSALNEYVLLLKELCNSGKTRAAQMAMLTILRHIASQNKAQPDAKQLILLTGDVTTAFLTMFLHRSDWKSFLMYYTHLESAGQEIEAPILREAVMLLTTDQMGSKAKLHQLVAIAARAHTLWEGREEEPVLKSNLLQLIATRIQEVLRLENEAADLETHLVDVRVQMEGPGGPTNFLKLMQICYEQRELDLLLDLLSVYRLYKIRFASLSSLPPSSLPTLESEFERTVLTDMIRDSNASSKSVGALMTTGSDGKSSVSSEYNRAVSRLVTEQLLTTPSAVGFGGVDRAAGSREASQSFLLRALNALTDDSEHFVKFASMLLELGVPLGDANVTKTLMMCLKQVEDGTVSVKAISTPITLPFDVKGVPSDEQQTPPAPILKTRARIIEDAVRFVTFYNTAVRARHEQDMKKMLNRKKSQSYTVLHMTKAVENGLVEVINSLKNATDLNFMQLQVLIKFCLIVSRQSKTKMQAAISRLEAGRILANNYERMSHAFSIGEMTAASGHGRPELVYQQWARCTETWIDYLYSRGTPTVFPVQLESMYDKKSKQNLPLLGFNKLLQYYQVRVQKDVKNCTQMQSMLYRAYMTALEDPTRVTPEELAQLNERLVWYLEFVFSQKQRLEKTSIFLVEIMRRRYTLKSDMEIFNYRMLALIANTYCKSKADYAMELMRRLSSVVSKMEHISLVPAPLVKWSMIHAGSPVSNRLIKKVDDNILQKLLTQDAPWTNFHESGNWDKILLVVDELYRRIKADETVVFRTVAKEACKIFKYLNLLNKGKGYDPERRVAKAAVKLLKIIKRASRDPKDAELKDTLYHEIANHLIKFIVTPSNQHKSQKRYVSKWTPFVEVFSQRSGTLHTLLCEFLSYAWQHPQPKKDTKLVSLAMRRLLEMEAASTTGLNSRGFARLAVLELYLQPGFKEIYFQFKRTDELLKGVEDQEDREREYMQRITVYSQLLSCMMHWTTQAQVKFDPELALEVLVHAYDEYSEEKLYVDVGQAARQAIVRAATPQLKETADYKRMLTMDLPEDKKVEDSEEEKKSN